MSDLSPPLTFTGERFAPEVTGAIWYEHWHRYCAVQPLAKGLTVLDAACGEGYGSYLLAQTGKEVIGVDIAADTIAHARARYTAPNLRFLEGSCTALPLPDGSVDLVVSFETIEHLWDQAEMLAEFRRVLAPGGALVISSPNQPVYSEFGAHINDFHVRELTREELAALLDPGFPQQRWYAQRVVAHSALWAEAGDAATPRKSALLALNEAGVHAEKEPGAPMYFVVVCGAAEARLPTLPSLSLFDDGRQTLYADYMRALLREKQLYWEELDARNIAEDRLTELINATNALASERKTSAALGDRVAVLEEAYREQSATLTARIKSLDVQFDAARAELAVEREYAASLTWEERNQRTVAESRLAELITTVNALSSAREKAVTLEAALATMQANLAAERERYAGLVWEERNWRKVSEDRLAELITTVNALSSEREKSAVLAARAEDLARVSEAARGAFDAVDRERTLLRGQLDAATVACTGLQGELAGARIESARADAALADLHHRLVETEAALAQARANLAQASDDLTQRGASLLASQSRVAESEARLEETGARLSESAARLAESQSRLAFLSESAARLAACEARLAESQSRLAFRETPMGWLRFPLAWLRMRRRGSG